MNNWITIISFTYPHEAHLAKGKLESEGIQVWIKDELTAQVNNFYSNAIGGVKLLVQESDFYQAYKILNDAGYINEPKKNENKLVNQFDKITAGIPFFGKLILEFRFLIGVSLILLIIAIPIIIFSLPSTLEKLTEKSWCVDKIYYKGQELVPNTYGLKVISDYNNCSEIMTFRTNGIVTFPGINSYGERGHWELKNNKLLITEWSINADSLIEKNSKNLDNEKNLNKSIYLGVYNIRIRNNIIEMQSDSLQLFGKVYRFSYLL